MQMIMID